jgi:SAM-dependent methyltransferase
MSKIDITDRYPPENEIRTDLLPYIEYGDCLLKTFNNISSLCDIGCATGHLIHYIRQKCNSNIKGYEYFSYHKDSSICKVKDDIEIYDIRDELPDSVDTYDIVNCSEVGEHIDPLFANILIENAKKLSNKYLIFTWSSHGGDLDSECDPLHQHLNPLSREEYINLMLQHGLKPNMELTQRFLNESMFKPNFYFWWRESFIVWEK